MKVDNTLSLRITSSVCQHVNITSAALWRERWRENPHAIRGQRLWGRYFGKQLPYEHFFLERTHRDKNYKRLATRSNVISLTRAYQVADGLPQKRRGPKPDARPAMTRRQQLNRQAQRSASAVALRLYICLLY